MEFTAENMSRMLGEMASDTDAARFAEFLISRGWELELQDGQIVASRNDEYMTESEWQEALEDAFEND